MLGWPGHSKTTSRTAASPSFLNVDTVPVPGFPVRSRATRSETAIPEDLLRIARRSPLQDPQRPRRRIVLEEVVNLL